MTTRPKRSKFVKGRRSRTRNLDAYLPPVDAAAEPSLSFEELVKKRVNGEVTQNVWKKYLIELPNDEARVEAKKNYQVIAKAVHVTRSQEAKINQTAAKELAKVKKSDFEANHPHFSKLYDTVVKLFVAALKEDKETLTKDKKLLLTALAGKWAPTINGAIDFSTSLGKSIARSLYLSSFPVQDWTLNEKKKAHNFYRKEYLTPLRAYVHSPETFMSSKKWSEISYDRVASVSMKRNKEVFLKRDAERFGKYLEDVKAGVKKIASGALLPHEIVQQFLSHKQADELEQVAELQWTSYVDNLKKLGSFESAMSVCDVSGSMDGDPMNVAIALSLLTASLSKPPFSNFICSFSESPSLHLVNQPTLKEKVSFVRNMDWGMNTNMQVKLFTFKLFSFIILNPFFFNNCIYICILLYRLFSI